MQPDKNASYLDLLKEEFEQRRKKNPLYSLRRFSQQLQVSSAYLSLLFSGRRNLSRQTGARIIRNLNWTTAKKKYFLSLLNVEKSGTDFEQSLAKDQLRRVKSTEIAEYEPIPRDRFEIISNWRYSACLTLLTIQNLNSTDQNIARMLGLKLSETQTMLRRLAKQGLVRKMDNGEWKATRQSFVVEGLPKSSTLRYHEQILLLARKALKEKPIQERDISNATITLEKSRLDEAKQMILEFQKELMDRFESTQADSVYQLSIQLFPLTQMGG